LEQVLVRNLLLAEPAKRLVNPARKLGKC